MKLTLAQKLRADRRFDAKHIPVTESGCWLWTGFVNRGGYGRFRVASEKMLAHRYSWTRAGGVIGPTQCVLHRCDTPSCVNPDHLFLGSKADNNADKVSKCRQSRGIHHASIMKRVAARGERAGRSVLTDIQVREVRSDARNNCEIARFYGVSNSCIWSIKHGRTRCTS